MDLEGLRNELKMILLDPTVDARLTDWINEAREELSAEYEFPALKLQEPVSVAVTTADWLYDMPASYQKHVFRARNSDTNGYWFMPIYRNISAVDRRDFAHTETGTRTQMLAVEGNQFAVYPKANDTIHLYYYKKPDPLVDDDDVPSEIPTEFHHQVIIPSVVLRAYRAYPELARENIQENTHALNLWRRKRHEGLYGSHVTGSIGLLNFFLKSRPPRVHGGRNHLP